MSKQALIVDSDFFFLEFFSDLLEKRGYTVIKAHDGKDGLIKLNEFTIDFLFLEIIIPKIDGKQLIHYVRQKFAEEKFPIIVVSAYLVEQMDELDEIGADYYIAKGAMEKLGDHLDAFMEGLEKGTMSEWQSGNVFTEPGQLYPRQATSQLLDLVSYHEAVTESMATGILVTDTDAKILHANAAALSLINNRVENIINCPVTGIFPAEEKEKIVESLKRAVREGDEKNTGISIKLNSKKIHLMVSALEMKGKKLGWVISLCSSSEDITFPM